MKSLKREPRLRSVPLEELPVPPAELLRAGRATELTAWLRRQGFDADKVDALQLRLRVARERRALQDDGAGEDGDEPWT